MVEDPDLFLGGPLPLFFQRYYASGLLDDNLVLSSLGINWMHNFELSLLHIGNEIEIAFLGGLKIQFQLNMSEWELVGTSDIPFQLVASGPDFLLADPRTHIIYQFDSGGKLISIADRNGNALTLTYNNNLWVYSRICGWVTSLTRGNRVGEHKEKSGRCPETRSSTAGGAGRCFLCIWD